MITVKFKGGQKVRAIILDEQIHRALSGNGVSGVVECAYCNWRAGLFHTGNRQIAEEIERFAKEHECTGPHPSKETFIAELVKSKEVEALGGKG